MRNLTMSTWIRRGRTWLGSALLASVAVALTPASAAAQAEVVEYYATDAVGSIRVVFAPDGNVKARSDYLPFGEALNTTGSLPAQRFTGQERDGEAGLDHFNARAMLTRVGRFNRLDPAGGMPTDPQSWNRYAYVSNNPIGFNDPTGMYSTPSTGCGQGPGHHYWCPGNTGPTNVDDYFNPDKYGYQGGEMEAAESTYGARVDAVFFSNYDVAQEQRQSREAEQAAAAAAAARPKPTIEVKEEGHRIGAVVPKPGHNTPTVGTPNTTEHFQNKSSDVIRRYGPDGRAHFDIDNNKHRGVRDIHAHEWKDGKRGPPIGLFELIRRLMLTPVLMVDPCAQRPLQCQIQREFPAGIH
jgi:RHS repeat-associated protein